MDWNLARIERSEFSVDGNKLNTDPEKIANTGGHWVTDAQKLHGPNNLNIQTVKLGGRFGEQVIPGTHTAGPAAFSLTMSYCAQSYNALMGYKTKVESILAPAGRPVTIRETDTNYYDDEEDLLSLFQFDISADAYLTGSSIGTMWDDAQLHGMDVEYTFTIPAGVWRSTEPDSIQLLPNNKYEARPLIPGSAPRYDNIIKVNLLPGGHCRIVNHNHNDVFIQINNPTTAVLSVEMDTRTGIAMSGGRVVQNYVTIGSRPFFIDPNVNIGAYGAAFPVVLLDTYRAWY
ncbi:hypothetical protein [Corynebacterium minutissimum]|uniref:Phage tail protein n=1 Tax=Corynebacterium minutissimum TaxID=38301 RepID=A0A376CWV0_9CORY|nr:hypothetical protein [Corynebacterium minutissimum]QRP60671.1 hypothetical protein I6J26_11045 [Corynebacterium minutissimum]STC76760.1 Uncharacterised protein [Corynebacterium minutissimum]